MAKLSLQVSHGQVPAKYSEVPKEFAGDVVMQTPCWDPWSLSGPVTASLLSLAVLDEIRWQCHTR